MELYCHHGPQLVKKFSKRAWNAAGKFTSFSSSTALLGSLGSPESGTLIEPASSAAAPSLTMDEAADSPLYSDTELDSEEDNEIDSIWLSLKTKWKAMPVPLM